jgi:hypothetical protein
MKKNNVIEFAGLNRIYGPYSVIRLLRRVELYLAAFPMAGGFHWLTAADEITLAPAHLGPGDHAIASSDNQHCTRFVN